MKVTFRKVDPFDLWVSAEQPHRVRDFKLLAESDLNRTPCVGQIWVELEEPPDDDKKLYLEEARSAARVSCLARHNLRMRFGEVIILFISRCYILTGFQSVVRRWPPWRIQRRESAGARRGLLTSRVNSMVTYRSSHTLIAPLFVRLLPTFAGPKTYERGARTHS